MFCKQIEKKLRKNFFISYLKVNNESHKHNISISKNTHFRIIIVSNNFEKQKLVNRHRAIYHVLSEELKDNIHALALHSYTIKEWKDLKNKLPDLPNCYSS